MRTLGEEFALEMQFEHLEDAIRKGHTIVAASDIFPKVKNYFLSRGVKVQECKYMAPGSLCTIDLKSVGNGLFGAIGDLT